MGKRVKVVALATVVLVLTIGGLTWFALHPQKTLFHGKPESEWIKGINYSGDEAQLKQWRSFGPEGLRLLARNLNKDRFYRKAYRRLMPRLPGRVQIWLYSRLPKPADSHSTRMSIINLLDQLGKDAKPVEPAIARALNDDDIGVRQIAVGYYARILETMGKKEKRARLPDFINAMQDGDWVVRNNAAIVLWHYPEAAPMVTPVLVKALQDPAIHVRLLAAKALAHINLPAAVDAGAVPIAIEILKNPDDQIAFRAAELLGDMGKEPALAVPALIAAVEGTNGLVATTAAKALGSFPGQADIIVPVLLKALADTNGIVSHWAPAAALKAIDPAAAAKAGVK